MARFVIGTSLKMYFGLERMRAWTQAVTDIVREHEATRSGDVELFIVPSFTSIPAAIEITGGSGIVVGAQDAHFEDAGAFTGEVSPAELAEHGVGLVEIGHAERRAMFGETDESVARKVEGAFRNGLGVVLCIGEPTHGEPAAAAAACVAQLEASIARVRAAGTPGRLVVAYEPVWAIGAPEPASVQHITTVTRVLRDHVSQDALLPDATVIYGGSAGPGLLPRIAADVDGMFLGRFAHDPQAVRAILDEALELTRKRS